MAEIVNILVDQGANYKHVFEYQHPDGSPVDLRDWVARMQVRRTWHSVEVLWSAEGLFTVNGLDGEVVLEVPAAISSAWAWRSGVYDVEIVAVDGQVVRLAQGRITVANEVTR